MSKPAKTTKTRKAAKQWAPKPETRALMLRTCDANLRAHGKFQWPESGYVEAPDWKPTNACGNGLHGLLWGVGSADLLDLSQSAKWLVCEIDTAESVDLGDKVKVRRCNVLFVGERADAVAMVQAEAPVGSAVVFATVTGGDFSTVTGGDGATVTGGYRATVTGGDGATVTGGYGATVTGGYGATVTGGYGATVTGGDFSTVTGGDFSTVTGGDGATVTGGLYGCLAIEWHDGKRYRKAIAEIDGETIKANVKYRVDNGRFIELSP